MSDHDHDHDHGPGGHSHGPDSHTHGPGAPAPKPAPAPLPPGETTEEAGTRALTEALGSSFILVKGIMVLLIVVFFGSGMFTVEPNEKAMVLQFGEPKGGADPKLYPPGWHWAWPYPIDEVVKVPMGLFHLVKSTVGWFPISKEEELAGREPAATGSLNPAVDGYTISADGNIMHARATVRYHIINPVAYEFDYAVASNHVQNALNHALTYASARVTVDQATRLEIAAFKDKVLNRCAELVKDRKLGVELDLRNSTVEARPPRQVRDAFNAVLDAEQDRGKQINEAKGKANETVSKAKGESAAIISGAKADASRIEQSASADAASFKSQLARYQANPEFFEQRRLVETMSRVLTNVQEKYYLPENEGQRRELRLLLNREPIKPPVAPTP